MKLPNAKNAIIPVAKLRDYVLSSAHPVGRFKSVYFRGLGYNFDAYETLASDIHSILGAEAEIVETTRFGSKYLVRGTLIGPNGRLGRIVTVQIAPRFVTAYPED